MKIKQTNDGIQNLQIFLGRASSSGPIRNEEHHLNQASNITLNDRASPYATARASIKTPRKFPDFVAISNSEAVETIQLPFSPQSLNMFLSKISSNHVSLQECINFGGKLFDAVFFRSIRDQLRSLTSHGSKLRLTIATSVPELQILPWELLCDTQVGVLPRFLCLGQELRFSRSLRLFNRALFERQTLGGETLRILLVTASPSTLPLIDTQKEEEMLRFGLDETPALQGVDLHILHDATVNEFRKRLEHVKPHIVHICCHGGFKQLEGGGRIALCQDSSGTDPEMVEAFRFASLLREPNSVQLVFLNTCHGATQNPIATFTGVAECLHASGISAVVGLQFLLQDRTGHAISLNFYRHLLRDRLTVEESVTKIRQYLFFNNYLFSECFGLAFFQDNCSLAWRHQESEATDGEYSKPAYVEYVNAFEDRLKEKALEKLSTVFDQITGKYDDLNSLTVADFALVLNVFGDNEIWPDILKKIQKIGIPFPLFLRMAKLALVLCHSTHEREHLTTSLLLFAPADPDGYLREHELEISENLDSDFFWGEIKRVVGEAIKVNGTDRAFAALASENPLEIRYEHIRNLKALDNTLLETTHIVGDPKWKRVFAATAENGCAFILPDLARIKLVVGGELIAEYRQGKWTNSGLSSLEKVLPDLSSDTGIDLKLLFDVIQKAIVASDQGSGRTFIIQEKGGERPRLAPGYKNILEVDGSNELKMKNFVDFEPTEYLKLTEGDGAVVISSEGQTLAVNAKLSPTPDTQVNEIVSSGTRHLSAQKITKESGCVAVVVSDDGPVTVFFEGRPVFRKL